MDNIASEIRLYVRSGFWEPNELIELFCEEIEMYQPGELDEDTIIKKVTDEFNSLKIESETWPQVTDCDKIDRIFDELNEIGIISRQNAGYTQSDGYSDVIELYERIDDKSKIVGYCFYHGQDLERVVNGDNLWLSFGPIDPNEEQTVGVNVGNRIVDTFDKYGFASLWNGTFSKRIEIIGIKWQKRLKISR